MLLNALRSKKRQFGFSLMEILIAIFIFAIISFIASGVLSSVFSTRKATDTRSHRLAEIQIATILMRRDFQQIVNRPVRAPNGNTIPSIIAQAQMLSFTRTGHPNPFGVLQQSNLQRVSYEIKNHELIRITWPRLDRVSSTKPVKRVLLKNIISGNFKYLGTRPNFYLNWPPAYLMIQANQGRPENYGDSQNQGKKQNQPQSQTTPIPRAIALSLKLKYWGEYYLVVPVASSQL